MGEGLGVSVGSMGRGELAGASVGCAVGTGLADGAGVGAGRAVGVVTTVKVPEGVGVAATGGVAVELSGRGRGVTQPSDRRATMAVTRTIAATRPRPNPPPAGEGTVVVRPDPAPGGEGACGRDIQCSPCTRG